MKARNVRNSYYKAFKAYDCQEEREDRHVDYQGILESIKERQAKEQVVKDEHPSLELMRGRK
jgi:hypothetical protein